MPWPNPGFMLVRALGVAGLLVFDCAAGKALEDYERATLALPCVLYLGLTVAAAERVWISRTVGWLALLSAAPAWLGKQAGSLGGTGILLWIASAALCGLLLESLGRSARSKAKARWAMLRARWVEVGAPPAKKVHGVPS